MEKGPIPGIDSSLALEWFDQNSGNRGSVGLMALQQSFECLQIVVREVVEAIDQRFKPLVIFGLTGGRDSGQGAAVETGGGRENDGTCDVSSQMAVFASQFDRRFVRLCT